MPTHLATTVLFLVLVKLISLVAIISHLTAHLRLRRTLKKRNYLAWCKFDSFSQNFERHSLSEPKFYELFLCVNLKLLILIAACEVLSVQQALRFADAGRCRAKSSVVSLTVFVWHLTRPVTDN